MKDCKKGTPRRLPQPPFCEYKNDWCFVYCIQSNMCTRHFSLERCVSAGFWEPPKPWACEGATNDQEYWECLVPVVCLRMPDTPCCASDNPVAACLDDSDAVTSLLDLANASVVDITKPPKCCDFKDKKETFICLFGQHHCYLHPNDTASCHGNPPRLLKPEYCPGNKTDAEYEWCIRDEFCKRFGSYCNEIETSGPASLVELSLPDAVKALGDTEDVSSSLSMDNADTDKLAVEVADLYAHALI